MSMSEAGAAFLAADDGGAPAIEPAAGAPAVETPPTPAPAAPAEAEPAAPAAEADKGPVPWGEHKKAQDEAARYRTQLRAYEEAFAAWDPQDAKVLLKAVGTTAELIRQGRTAEAGSIFRDIAAVFGPEAAQAVVAGAEGVDDEGDELLTRADVERLLAERDQGAAYERGVQTQLGEIQSTGKELGYDVQSPEWAVVLSEAINLHDGDVRAAHEAIKAREQAVIDAYLAGKRNTADMIPTPAGGSTPPAPMTTPPEKIEDASTRLRAALESGAL